MYMYIILQLLYMKLKLNNNKVRTLLHIYAHRLPSASFLHCGPKNATLNKMNNLLHGILEEFDK